MAPGTDPETNGSRKGRASGKEKGKKKEKAKAAGINADRIPSAIVSIASEGSIDADIAISADMSFEDISMSESPTSPTQNELPPASEKLLGKRPAALVEDSDTPENASSEPNPWKRQRDALPWEQDDRASDSGYSSASRTSSAEHANASDEMSAEPQIPITASVPPKISKLPNENLVSRKGPSLATKKSFNLLDAIARRIDICTQVAAFLDPESLITWFSVHKVFHLQWCMNARSFALANVKKRYPGAIRIFPFEEYMSACMVDPSTRGHRWTPRPRWVSMVSQRYWITEQIAIKLYLLGLPLMPGGTGPLLRLWRLMDWCNNARRITLAGEISGFFSDQDLVELVHFFIMVDLAFTNPNSPLTIRNHNNAPADVLGTYNGTALRGALLESNSLVPIWRVLHGYSPWLGEAQRPPNRFDMCRLFARRWGHTNSPDLHAPIYNLRLYVRNALQGFPETGRDKTVTTDNRTGQKSEELLNQKLLRADEVILQAISRRPVEITECVAADIVKQFIKNNDPATRRHSEEELNNMVVKPWEKGFDPENIIRHRAHPGSSIHRVAST